MICCKKNQSSNASSLVRVHALCFFVSVKLTFLHHYGVGSLHEVLQLRFVVTKLPTRFGLATFEMEVLKKKFKAV